MTIIDNSEHLVDIKIACPTVVIDLTGSRSKNEDSFYLRETVAKMLQKASDLLPDGYKLIVADAWRPKSIQQKYFNAYLNKFKKENPKWPMAKLINYTSNFAISPDDEKRAGHLTGAAVDLGLWKNGRRVPMNSLKISFQNNSLSNQEQLPTYIQNNRKLLSEVMSRAGFTNYPKEYWHWSYGDVMWAELNNKNTAIYGVIENINLD
jgi:D-alanyl-D-alanine dipeptidase